MLADVKTCDFLLGRYTDADGFLEDEPCKGCCRKYKRTDCNDTEKLCTEEFCTATVEKTVYGRKACHALFGKKAHADCTEYATAEMD